MEYEFDLNGRIWLEIKGEKVLGHGRVELLERIDSSGSIRQAAMQMKMSYRQAWEMIKQINSFFETPVVISNRGGKGGGNALITPLGLSLIQEFHRIHDEFKKFMSQNSVVIYPKDIN
jgi:molybdate transport system regulatory protein